MPNSSLDIIQVNGFPITLAFSKNNRAFLSERVTGNLWEIIPKSEEIQAGDFRLVKNFKVASHPGHHEKGLLGITLDPDFEMNSWIYCYYTYGNFTEGFANRVVRINETGNREEILLDEIPAGRIHNGGILAFAPDKTLYTGVGVENLVQENAQQIETLDGKVLRINPDGSIPHDNPFRNSPVYSFGHRNIFGLAFHPQTGQLYITEPGPDKNDEINIIKKGGNYGWPKVTGITDDPMLTNPIMVYEKVITPTQCTFVNNDLYFGSYNEGTVHKLTLSGNNFNKVEKDEIVYQTKPFGVLGVFHSPDNKFFVTTPNTIEQFGP